MHPHAPSRAIFSAAGAAEAREEPSRRAGAAGLAAPVAGPPAVAVVGPVAALQPRPSDTGR